MEIGQMFDLLIKDTESNQMIEYRCKIIGINQKFLFIDYPIHKDTQRTTYFPKGTNLLVTYTDQDKNLYQFHTKIQKRVTLTMPALALEKPEKSKIKQVQRREYVRVMTAIDIAIHPTDQSFTPFTTVTNDISGGGVSIVIPSKVQLEKGQKTLLSLVLHLRTGIEYIDLQGEVIQIYQLKGSYQSASIKFKSINDQVRQTIIQFVFEKQREARNKELI